MGALAYAYDAPLRSDEVARHDVRMVVVASGEVVPFRELPAQLRRGDLVVVNDAATLPGSLRAGDVELRLSGPVEGNVLCGVLLGAGDFHTRTEDRPAPRELAIGTTLRFGALAARIVARDGRRVELVVDGDGDALWQALYASGAPVQYAHRRDALPLDAVQTAYATRPWAAEMPSAGRPLTWDVIVGLRRAGIAIATLTHAAGLSSTGDARLDAALPWPERYEIPEATARAIAATRAAGGRVIAIGTTVVRALEASGGAAGAGIARLRLDPAYRTRVVDGVVSGLHAPGESHFELLGAFAPRETLVRAIELAGALGLSSHELGDSCLVVR